MATSDEHVSPTEYRLRHILLRLREGAHRVTPQRVAILRVFLTHRGHPSAEEIHRQLADQYPMMALSTVYNTLALLVEMGEAVEVSPATPVARFDPDTSDHCHLTCVDCGRIIDLPMSVCVGGTNLLRVSEEHGFRPLRQVYQVFGQCADCQQ